MKGILPLALLIISTFVLSACSETKWEEETKEIFTSPDGFATTNLVWSPSGDKLSITTFNGQNGESQIFVWNMPTEEVRLLYSNSDVSADSWSPNEDQLALTTLSGIALLDMASSSPVPNFIITGQQPAWLPKDESKLAYYGYLINNPGGVSSFELKTYDLVTGDEDVITQVNSTIISALAWSPDGDILATVLCSMSCNIFLVDILSQAVVPFTRNSDGTDSFDPSWSADGRYIAYLELSENGVEPDVFIKNIQGNCETELQPARGAWSLSWSPAGEYLAYTYNKNREVRLLNLKDLFGDDFLSKLDCNKCAASPVSGLWFFMFKIVVCKSILICS